jgi:uncharacterized membrane protein HdeD (DUF308 family)
MYSQWYLNFGEYDASTYQLLYVAYVVAVAAIVLLTVLRADRSATKFLVAVSAVVAAVVPVIGFFKPALVETVAGVFYGIQPLYQIAIYITIYGAVLLIAYYLHGESLASSLK